MFGREPWLDIPGLPRLPVCEHLTDPELFYKYSMLEFHEMNERDRVRALATHIFAHGEIEGEPEKDRYRVLNSLRCAILGH